MHANRELQDISDSDLMLELRDRGYVLSVWSHEDVSSAMAGDEEFADVSKEEREVLARAALYRMRRNLEDRLAERGNEFISDMLSEYVADAREELSAEAAPGA